MKGRPWFGQTWFSWDHLHWQYQGHPYRQDLSVVPVILVKSKPASCQTFVARSNVSRGVIWVTVNTYPFNNTCLAVIMVIMECFLQNIFIEAIWDLRAWNLAPPLNSPVTSTQPRYLPSLSPSVLIRNTGVINSTYIGHRVLGWLNKVILDEPYEIMGIWQLTYKNGSVMWSTLVYVKSSHVTTSIQ